MSLNTPPLSKIAEAAGVSKAAVSMALRNHPSISDARKKQILEIAQSMGYRPNPMVASLMTHIRSSKKPRTGSTLAVLGPEGIRDQLLHSEFSYPVDLFKTIRQRAKQLGYSIEIVSPTNPGDSIRSLAKSLAYRGIRGLLIPPFPYEHTRESISFDRDPFALVVVGYSQEMPGEHRVAHDQFGIGRMLFEETCRRGYQKVGLQMAEEFNERTGNYYVGAFLDRQFKTSIDAVQPAQIFLREDWNEKMLVDWIKNNQIDCLVSQFTSAYDMLQRAGFRIPADIGFCLITQNIGKSFMSGVIHDPTELGIASVDLLTSVLQRNEVGKPSFAKTILTQPKWHEGETLRKPV